MKKIALTVELADGTTHDITPANPSLVAWDRTRSTRKWPTVEEAPMLWMTFIAWHHMKAAGLVTVEYPEFESTLCVSVGDTVKPLTDAEHARMAQLRSLDEAGEIDEDDAVELAQLVERDAEAQADEDPTPPAHDRIFA